MTIYLLSFLLATHPGHADTASWTCRCFEHEQEGMMVSLDASLPLAEAQSKAMAVCQAGGNPKSPTRADCVEHWSKDIPPVASPRPIPAPPPEVKAAYKVLLNAHEKKDYAGVLKQANLILSRGKDYNDTRAYRDIAREHLAKNEASCRKAGGEWGTWTRHDGAINHATCRWRAEDAGRACRESKDCSSYHCEWDLTKKAGACAAFASAEGCHTWVEKGAPQPTICVD